MPRLISVYTGARLLECPPRWDRLKDVPLECSIYESENKAPGKRWFYVFDDSDPMTVSYMHCSLADVEYRDDGTAVFDTASGNRYVISLGEEQPAGYAPYRVAGHGGDARILPGTAALNEMLASGESDEWDDEDERGPIHAEE